MNEQQIITLMRIGGKIISYLGVALTTAGIIYSYIPTIAGGLLIAVIGCTIHEVGEMIE